MLSTPTNLRASTRADGATIRWNAVTTDTSGNTVSGVSYVLDGAITATTTNTSRSATLSPGSHTVGVKASKTGYTDSSRATLTFTIGDTQKLATPTLTATPSYTSVSLAIGSRLAGRRTMS